MAFAVCTSEDRTPHGSLFADDDTFTISASGLLTVKAAGRIRIYAPGFWQLVEYAHHHLLPDSIGKAEQPHSR